jgi:hypothetical protein
MSISILSSYLCLGLPGGLLLPGFPTKTLYALFFLPMRATFLAHLILFDLIILIIFGDEYSYGVPHCVIFTNLLLFHPSSVQTFSSTPFFWNTLNLCSILNIRDQISHQYKTTGKIIVLYILIFTFLDYTIVTHWFLCLSWSYFSCRGFVTSNEMDRESWVLVRCGLGSSNDLFE